MHNQAFNNDKAYSISDVADSVVCSSEEIPLVNVTLYDIIVFRFSFAICMPIEKNLALISTEYPFMRCCPVISCAKTL